MLLRISAGIAALLAVSLFVFAWRGAVPRLRGPLRWVGVGAVILAVILLVWPLPLTVYHQADVPAGTLVLFQTADVHDQQVTNEVLHALRGTDATEVWHIALSDASTAHMDGDQVLVQSSGQHGSSLAARRARDGHPLWQISNLPPFSQFTYAGTTAYVYTIDAAKQLQVAAYSLTTQQPLWSTPLTVPDAVEVVGQPNALYLIGKAITAVRPADGQVLWHQQSASSYQTHTVALPGLVVLSDMTTVRAYDAQTGQVRWTSEVIPQGVTSLIAGEGLILGATLDGRIIGWDASAGTKVWQHALSVIGPPTVAGHVIYYTAAATTNAPSQVSAYEMMTGTRLWQTPVTSADATAVIASDVIADNSYDSRFPSRPSLMFLDAATGRNRLTITASGQYTHWSPPYRVGNTLFVTVDDTQPGCSFNCGSGSALWAYDVRDGHSAWELHASGAALIGTL